MHRKIKMGFCYLCEVFLPNSEIVISLLITHLIDRTINNVFPHIIINECSIRKLNHVNFKELADFAVSPYNGIIAKN